MRNDKVITCQQCGQDFAWTQEEQEFYQVKGWQPPSHCPICRATHRAAAEDKFRGKLR